MHSTGGAEFEWRKSSYSGGGNDCVEVAFAGSTPMVRDSKNPDAGAILVDTRQWSALLSAVRDGCLSRD